MIIYNDHDDRKHDDSHGDHDDDHIKEDLVYDDHRQAMLLHQNITKFPDMLTIRFWPTQPVDDDDYNDNDHTDQ